MPHVFRFLSVLALCLLPCMAHADEYIAPTPKALLQTMLRFGALDINNDVVIDDYAKIMECDLYSVFHENDFKWHKIRDGLRNKIRDEAITYPTYYTLQGYVSLDRYDFNNKMFKLKDSAQLMGVNSFAMAKSNALFCDAKLKIVPMDIHAVIESRINIPGFIMSEADASALLSRLLKDGNHARQILAKFNFRIVDVPKLRIDYGAIAAWYDKETFVGKMSDVNMAAKLDSVEFYEDEAMKRRLFVYKP